MDWLSWGANVVTFLCLPATIAAIPGFLAVFSDSVRNWLKAHNSAAIGMVVVLVVVALFDAGARLELFPKSWFSQMTPVWRRTYRDEELLLDNKALAECVICVS